MKEIRDALRIVTEHAKPAAKKQQLKESAEPKQNSNKARLIDALKNDGYTVSDDYWLTIGKYEVNVMDSTFTDGIAEDELLAVFYSDYENDQEAGRITIKKSDVESIATENTEQLDESYAAEEGKPMARTAAKVSKIIDMINSDNVQLLNKIINKNGYTGDISTAVEIYNDAIQVKWAEGATAKVLFDAAFADSDGDDGEVAGCVFIVNNGTVSFDWGGDGAFFHDE